MELIYATGNSKKFIHAKEKLAVFGIDLIQKDLEIEEIQADSISKIAEDKAKKAFTILQKPLIVSDSGWKIPALNGFPGPYMKYVNYWFKVEDFLALMKDKSDRSITLTHVVAVADQRGTKVFEQKINGKILDKPDGDDSPLNQIVVLEGNEKTIAQNNNNDLQSSDDSELWSRVLEDLSN